MADPRAARSQADWAEVWAAVLDDLELSLDQTERLLRGESPSDSVAVTPWTPPNLQGPLPPDLRTRALALHHRQQKIIRATAEAAAATRRQTELTAKMSAPHQDADPVYLDVTA